MKIATSTAEELQRQKAQAEGTAQAATAELERRAREQADADAEKQHAADQKLIERHRDMDNDLIEANKQHEAEFNQAVDGGDLIAAVHAYVNMRATREARRHIRDAATGAANRTPTWQSTLPDIRYIQMTLMDLLEPRLIDAASKAGAKLADQYLEEFE